MRVILVLFLLIGIVWGQVIKSDIFGEVSGSYQLDTGFYFEDVTTNQVIQGVNAAQSVQPGSNLTTRCLDNFGSYVHPVAGRIFQNVGGLMFDVQGSFVAACDSSYFLMTNRLFSFQTVLPPSNYRCGPTTFTNPGWNLFYHQERHGENSLRYCDASVISATRFTDYPDCFNSTQVQNLLNSVVWHNGNEGNNPLGNQSFCYTDPIPLSVLGTYQVEIDVVTGVNPTTVQTLGPIGVFIKLSNSPLAFTDTLHCNGADCCYLTIDCLANLKDILFKGGSNLRDPFITSTQNPYWDDLCPFPVCAYGYQFDNRVYVAPNGSLVGAVGYNFQWTPTVIPYIKPDPQNCIIRSPDPSQGLRVVPCNQLNVTTCEIPVNSYQTNKKREYILPDYSAQFKSLPCSDLSQYTCEYLSAFGVDSYASCEGVYITFPTSNQRDYGIPSTDYVTKTSQEYQSVPNGACVRYLGPTSNPQWIYHVPYTSMLHCMADHPRSTAKWCTGFFQEAYYECKAGAGLINGG